MICSGRSYIEGYPQGWQKCLLCGCFLFSCFNLSYVMFKMQKTVLAEPTSGRKVMIIDIHNQSDWHERNLEKLTHILGRLPVKDPY